MIWWIVGFIAVASLTNLVIIHNHCALQLAEASVKIATLRTECKAAEPIVRAAYKWSTSDVVVDELFEAIDNNITTWLAVKKEATE